VSEQRGAGRARGAVQRNRPAPAGTRTPRSSKTRAAILAAARRLFASRGFDHVSLREIGAEARADPALVARYFGGKEGLFAEALAASNVSDALIPGDCAAFPHRAARAAVLGEWRSTGFEGLLIALRSASSPAVSDSLIRPFEQRFVRRLAEGLGGDEHMARAHLAFASIAGTALLHGMRSPGSPGYSPEQARTIAEYFAHDLNEMMKRGGQGRRGARRRPPFMGDASQ